MLEGEGGGGMVFPSHSPLMLLLTYIKNRHPETGGLWLNRMSKIQFYKGRKTLQNKMSCKDIIFIDNLLKGSLSYFEYFGYWETIPDFVNVVQNNTRKTVRGGCRASSPPSSDRK